MIKFVTIDIEARENLCITNSEYILCWVIYFRQTAPSGIGWCWESKKNLATYVGCRERNCSKLISSLLDKQIIQRHEITKHLRTTQIWYDNAVWPTISTKCLSDKHKVLNNTVKSAVSTQSKVPTNNTIEVNYKNNDRILRFVPPKINEIKDFFIGKGWDEIKSSLESEKFFSFYESNGWKVGPNKMKVWKGAAAGWFLRNETKNHVNTTQKNGSASKGRPKNNPTIEGTTSSFNKYDNLPD